jgi:hypothetical protein
VGEAFLCFDFAFGVAVGVGVGEAFLCFGEGEGDGVGVAFFDECFRCFPLGVGVGSKAFLILVPNDSCAGFAASTAQNKIAIIKIHLTDSKRVVL